MEFVEKLSGDGQVFDGVKKIADVAYEINVYQERINTSTHGDDSSIPGMKRAVLALNKPVGVMGGKLTLLLKDGRKMDFHVMGYNNYAPTGPIA